MASYRFTLPTLTSPACMKQESLGHFIYKSRVEVSCIEIHKKKEAILAIEKIKYVHDVCLVISRAIF